MSAKRWAMVYKGSRPRTSRAHVFWKEGDAERSMCGRWWIQDGGMSTVRAVGDDRPRCQKCIDDSPIDVEKIIRNDLAKAIGQSMDMLQLKILAGEAE